MEAQLTLWGIYGEIEGDHDVLISHLPLFRCGAVFYAALTPGWTLTPSALLKLDSADEAALVGTPLKLAHSTTIELGQLVAVMGPNFVQFVETLGVSGDPFFATDDWLVAQDGFRVRCATRAELDEHWKCLTLQALRAFDAEFRTAAGRSVSRRAGAALGIFRTSPFCNRDQRFWRVATARQCEGDADGYNRSLLLAAAELKRPFAELDEEVRSWVRTTLSGITAFYPSSISFEQLATIEKDVKDLVAVVVIADMLDDPGRVENKNIYDAMYDNFMEGVRYSFLISPGHFDKRRDEFMRYIEAVYTKARYEAPGRGPKSRIRKTSFEALCRIWRLNRPWDSYPYIFYRLQGNVQDSFQTIAYRGGDPLHGLSIRYYAVESTDAGAILDAACAMVPDEHVLESVVPKREEITTASNVVRLLGI